MPKSIEQQQRVIKFMAQVLEEFAEQNCLNTQERKLKIKIKFDYIKVKNQEKT